MTTTTTTKVTTQQPQQQPSRRSPGQWAKSWEPDPRWYHPVIAALALYALGWVPGVWPQVPPWAMASVGLAGAAVGVLCARRAYPEWAYGRDHAGQVGGLAVAAGVAAAVWLVYAGYTSPLRAAGWLALATVVFGGFYALLVSQAPRRAQRVAAQAAVAAERAAQAWVARQWSQILARAGFPGMVVLSSTETRAGYTLVVQVNPEAPVTVGEVRQQQRKIAVNAAITLARHGITLRESDLRVEDTRAAHVFLIHVSTKGVLAESVPFPLDSPGASINDPCDIGLYEDGRNTDLVLVGKHGMIVGATGSGKTVALNSIVGRVTERYDALVWIAATDKLIPLVYPWLRPWFDGRCQRPVLDWVAGQSHGEVLRMLAAAYQLMKQRNAELSNQSSLLASPREPAVVVIIDEAADALRRREVITTFDGQQMSATKLVYEIARAGRSAEVSVLLAAGAALIDVLGDYGSETMRHLTLRICLRTMSAYDGTATLVGLPGTVDTTKLRDHSMLVQPSTEEPRHLPAKAYYVEKDAVHPVAIRNAQRRPDLETGRARHLGGDYAGRWDAERLPELVVACERDGFTWPGGGRGPAEDPATVDERFAAIVTANDLESRVSTDPSAIPDVSDGIEKLNEIASRFGQARPLERPVPEPLRAVIELLDEPGAPTEWVSTAKLAIVLGRAEPDASEERIAEAAAQLGRELALAVPNLRTRQRRAGDAPRARGYDVARLRAATAAAREGRELAPDGEIT